MTATAPALAVAGRLLATRLAERAVLACLGASAPTAVPAAARARARPRPCPDAALPIWLLVAGAEVDAAAAARALGAALPPLTAAGLVVGDGKRLRATAAVVALGAGLVVVDRLDATGADVVPWPDDSSLHLVGCLPAGHLGAWLDVGTGAGVAPLAAGPRAARIRATDVSAPALARAAQGAALSGRGELELVRADLLDGAGLGPDPGARWDLITFNAPLPAAHAAGPTSTWHREAPGAALVPRFWQAAAAHLAPGGEVLVHSAIDADPWAIHAGRGGAWTIARYTPPGVPGFAVTRWQPHGPARRELVDVALGRGRPYLRRADLAPW